MKFIALILSVYVMVLTTLPCADVHAFDKNSATIELTVQSQHYSNDVDLCSPFCFCNCCQTLSQANTFYTLQIDILASNLIVPTIVQNEIKSAISFWRPPKI